MSYFHFSKKSSNSKTGPIPTTTTSADTCPDRCPLKNNGCYADLSFQGMHWKKVTAGERGGTLTELCNKIAELPNGQLWRHNVSGDLPGSQDVINLAGLKMLVRANQDKRGFTYTHYPMDTRDNKVAVEWANLKGFTVNLSANSPAHADKLADLNIAPVVTLLPANQVINSFTPDGREIVVCPATYVKDVTCARCKLCSVAKDRPIIGFPAHGSKSKAVQEVMEANS